MNDIIFVNPPYDSIAPGYGFVRHITNRSPSLGLLHLAAQARADGYTPMIIESDIEGLSATDTALRVIHLKPRYLGITLFTTGVSNAVDIARQVKQALPNITILIGGPHVSSMGYETLARYPEFDIAVLSEGEQILSALLPVLDAQREPSEVNGILYRVAGDIKQTPPAPPILNLDALPMPAWDLLPNFPHAYLPAIYDYPRGPVATLAASRGCPFHCAFCDTSTFGARVRHYSPQGVFNIMRHLRETYDVRHVQFVDDLFVASRKRVLALCDLLLEHRLGMTWSCTARTDTVNPDVLKRMQAAGCWEISYGLETGAEDMLQKMDKCATVPKAEQAVQWTHAAGIRVKGLFMLGYPGENQRTIETTRAYVRRLPLTTMNLSKFTPYPGSPIYRSLYGTNIREEDWNRMNGMNFVWTPPGMNQTELERAYRQLLLSFYARPQITLHYLKMSLQYPRHLWRLSRFGWAYCRARLQGFSR